MVELKLKLGDGRNLIIEGSGYSLRGQVVALKVLGSLGGTDPRAPYWVTRIVLRVVVRPHEWRQRLDWCQFWQGSHVAVRCFGSSQVFIAGLCQ